jgi:hypothetical protein
MKLSALLAFTIAIAVASCENKTDSKASATSEPAKQEQATAASAGEEPILKNGHVFSGDCAATSLDWPGKYVGAVANKDSGIARLRLTLNKDWTYAVKVMALVDQANGDAKETLQKEYAGTFTWDKAGQIIKLLGANQPGTGEVIAVSVGENALSVLGADLKALGKDGDMNTLHKEK